MGMVETGAFTRLQLPVCKTTGRSASYGRNAHQQSAYKMPHGLGPVEIANQTGCSIVESCTDELCCEQSGCLGVWSGKGPPCPSSLLALAFSALPALLPSFISRMVTACKQCYRANPDLVASRRIQARDCHYTILCLALPSPLGSWQRRPR